MSDAPRDVIDELAPGPEPEPVEDNRGESIEEKITPPTGGLLETGTSIGTDTAVLGVELALAGGWETATPLTPFTEIAAVDAEGTAAEVETTATGAAAAAAAAAGLLMRFGGVGEDWRFCADVDTSRSVMETLSGATGATFTVIGVCIGLLDAT